MRIPAWTDRVLWRRRKPRYKSTTLVRKQVASQPNQAPQGNNQLLLMGDGEVADVADGDEDEEDEEDDDDYEQEVNEQVGNEGRN